jgi:hypothetical protein
MGGIRFVHPERRSPAQTPAIGPAGSLPVRILTPAFFFSIPHLISSAFHNPQLKTPSLFLPFAIVCSTVFHIETSKKYEKQVRSKN